MHRSRPFVLVILAAAAACSRREPAEGKDILSQDRTLVAHLQNDARPLPLPDACGTNMIAATPSAANQQQAEEMTRQAGVAEMHGDIQDARSLLRRAAALDGTNKSAAYHLGRTSEALGDHSSALTAYCHYLTLAPTAAESAEARQRVAGLSRSMPRAIASARVPRTTSARSSTRVVANGPVQPRTRQPQRRSRSTVIADARGSEASAGDVITSRPPAPTADPSPAQPRAQRRGSIGAQSTIIGVAAGAILGAATGRSVKSTVIGAAAGGVIGTVVGSATRPTGRGIRS